MYLFRPVGVRELELISESGNRRFPPRLDGQPFFYPVLALEYARQIAKDWNTKDAGSGFAGFVTKFEVDDSYAKQFEVHTVGSRDHQELWVPAERLDEFNDNILGSITVIESYHGDKFEGERN